MQIIEGLTDAEIAEAHRSKDVFAEVREMTAPLEAFLSLIHALDWLDLGNHADRASLSAFFDGRRLHQALGYRAPMAVWREGVPPKAYGDVDNACASTACPQADPNQRQTKPLAA